MDIAAIQGALAEENIDGWLLYDFRGSNPIARSVIGFDDHQIATRRWFYLIPRTGRAGRHPARHRAQRAARGARAKPVLYRSWRELEALLKTHLAGMKRVAMEYSPGAAIPYVRARGRGHHRDGRGGLRRRGGQLGRPGADVRVALDAGAEGSSTTGPRRDTMLAKDEAFALIRERLAKGKPVKESEVQAFIQSPASRSTGLYTHHPCIVAVNDHASDPHFETAAGAERPRDQEGRPGAHRPLGQGRERPPRRLLRRHLDGLLRAGRAPRACARCGKR